MSLCWIMYFGAYQTHRRKVELFSISSLVKWMYNRQCHTPHYMPFLRVVKMRLIVMHVIIMRKIVFESLVLVYVFFHILSWRLVRELWWWIVLTCLYTPEVLYYWCHLVILFLMAVLVCSFRESLGVPCTFTTFRFNWFHYSLVLQIGWLGIWTVTKF